MRLTSGLVRYLSRFDSRVIVFAIAVMLLTFCLVVSFNASAVAVGSVD
ncbi:MAG: hypothetical protein ABI873_04270 [Marmoricola sp.]